MRPLILAKSTDPGTACPPILGCEPAISRRGRPESAHPRKPTAALSQTIVGQRWFSSLSLAHNRRNETKGKQMIPDMATLPRVVGRRKPNY